jgi:hypothetical protein
MDKLLEKIGLKDFQRICIINPDNSFISAIKSSCSSIVLDREIDPRFLYNFIMVYVTSTEEIDELSNRVTHNLSEDGILWFAYPKNHNGGSITRDKGWEMLKTLGFKAVRQTAIDDSWSGIRFRNSKFVRKRYKIDIT